MKLILTYILLICNCYNTSEEKARNLIGEIGEGQYYTSKVIYIKGESKTSLFPIIAGYDYLFVVSNDSNKSPYFEDCGKDNMKINSEIDTFIEISIKNTNCATLIVGVK